MVRRPGGLKPHQARRQRSEELQQLVAPDRFGDNNAPRSINAMDLKNVLGQIETNGRTDDKSMIDFPTDVAPSDAVSTTTILARPSLSQMPRGRRPHHHVNRFYCSLLASPLDSDSINSMI
jgi:hypothetical protein